MLSKQETLKQYKKLETTIDNRFITRLADFLTVEELSTIGIEVKDEYKETWVVEKEWTKKNVIEQLVKYAEFGKDKAEGERGISSALMTEVCQAWLTILKDDEIIPDDWGYNLSFFEKILKKYQKEG